MPEMNAKFKKNSVGNVFKNINKLQGVLAKSAI